MEISLNINGQDRTLTVAAGDTLLDVLRREGYFGAKHGCEDGSCGACTVLVDGAPRTSCTMLAAQASGARISTSRDLPASRLTVRVPARAGAASWICTPCSRPSSKPARFQCGYCTPAMIMAARALLDRESSPSEAQVRDALSGVLCRCTGYLKPVQAVLRAAAVMRGESVPPIALDPHSFHGTETDGSTTCAETRPPAVTGVRHTPLRVVGKPEPRSTPSSWRRGTPHCAADPGETWHC